MGLWRYFPIFPELVTFVMNETAPDIVNLLIVLSQGTQAFGSLYEIRAENDEIFISDATVDDLEIIDAITASRLATEMLLQLQLQIDRGIQSPSPNTSTTATTATTTTTTTTTSTTSQVVEVRTWWIGPKRRRR